ncbi:MAG: 3-dehydroquinate synthase [Gammaproteobacteria bacterium]|nr:3-dehydroquinate synthase [Gammaproteobacteria bacterium]
MKKLTVKLGKRSYPIFIGENLLNNAELFKSNINSRQVMVVTNETIAPLYLDRLMKCLSDLAVDSIILPDGEEYKTLEVMNNIITKLLQKKFNRDCCLIALGGGVIGDITGFAAACYQRGIDYIQVPTTVLAQVDSSIGGKTGVNHVLGKNMIGAFHQPRAVIADISVLDTLDKRELSAGLAEVIKYGLIRDRKFYVWLEDNIDRLLDRESDALTFAIEKSCRNKAEIVAKDEKESGVRALLNLGHTFGHAIETGLGYKDWLHGEAVATGMLMATDLSCRHGWISTDDVARIKNILNKARLPVKLPKGFNPDRMLELMSIDKKTRDGVLHLVLLKDIGNAIITDQYESGKLRETLMHFSVVSEVA